ncbi:hypothetical protein FOZ63_034180 [Perkinsus olseni]|uniref:Uncharacterized protein n=1 Tax=Perkinsus olseni TaxID=32597 RepID=A0A7J6N471_PEROL|nr:hypothetical protein FOZ60_016898 [Perkinsus olseni]KAF4704000.1 hypothetical protein FOZ63_034180 [Perkinsus olseni]
MSSILVKISVLPIILGNSAAPGSLSFGIFDPAKEDLPNDVPHLRLCTYVNDKVSIGMLDMVKQPSSFLRRVFQFPTYQRSFFGIQARNDSAVLGIRDFIRPGLEGTDLHNFGKALCEALDPTKTSRITGVKVETANTPTAPDGSSVDGSSVDGSSVDGSPVDGSSVDGSSVDGSPVDGSSVYGFDEKLYETLPDKVRPALKLRVHSVDVVELTAHCTEILRHRRLNIHDPRSILYRSFRWSVTFKRDPNRTVSRLPKIARLTH